MFWGGSRNIANHFLDSSDGFTLHSSLTTSGSKIVTVQIAVNFEDESCNYGTWALAAKAAVIAQGVAYTNYPFR